MPKVDIHLVLGTPSPSIELTVLSGIVAVSCMMSQSTSLKALPGTAVRSPTVSKEQMADRDASFTQGHL